MSFEKKSLFQLSWPIFIELTLFMLMGMVDTFMLSAYSDNAVAAVGMSNQVINLIGVMFNFVAAGTIILVSQNLGAKNQTKACEVSIVSIGANFLIGIILSVVMITCSKYILTFMNTPLEIIFNGHSTGLKWHLTKLWVYETFHDYYVNCQSD